MNDNDGKYLSQIQSNSFKNKLLHQIHNILCQALPWTLRKQELHEPGSPSIHNTICLLYKKKKSKQQTIYQIQINLTYLSSSPNKLVSRHAFSDSYMEDGDQK